MSKFAAMLEQPDVKTDGAVRLEALATHLDGLDDDARVAQVTAIGKAEQVRLWEVAGAAPKAFALDFLVPPDAKPLAPFPFEGRNSLPLFTRFRKVFYKTTDGNVAGYNDQAMGWLTGPGYYIARATPEGHGPVVIDYTLIPTEKPAGWPPIRTNERGVSKLVYGFMHDYLRWISKDVVIGRAYKYGKETSNYFVLCRPKAR